MVPSSSGDVTRVLRGQPKQLSRNYLGRIEMAETSFYMILFHSKDVFCTLNRLFFFGRAFVCLFRLADHHLAVYSVLGSLMSKPQRQRVQWLCKRAL